MRPRKKVVLVAANEQDMSLWKVRIELVGYFVDTAPNSVLAADIIPGSSAVVVIGGDDRDVAMVKLGNYESKVLAVAGVHSEQCQADARELPGRELVERVLRTLRVLTSRKRGPKNKASGDTLMLNKLKDEATSRKSALEAI